MADHKPDDKLPVTAELGDEGGSFGDATVQAETFKGPFGNERVDPKRAGPIAREEPRPEDEPTVKPPTEP